jgi:nicotinate-nucleotide--dimethylbenzimidazole phosphoribosyltransferase
MAVKLKPEVADFLIAGHCSTEPASRIAITNLQLKPILDLNLRLGEGTGAVLSIPILRAACLAYERMGKLGNYI